MVVLPPHQYYTYRLLGLRYVVWLSFLREGVKSNASYDCPRGSAVVLGDYCNEEVAWCERYDPPDFRSISRRAETEIAPEDAARYH